MAKMSRKELRRELRELIFPVITHLHELLENGKAANVLDFEHRGEKMQAQFHANEMGLAIYILYWYGVTIAFKVSPEELSTVLAKSVEWYSDKFVELNETLIGRVYRSKPTLH